MRRLAYIFAAAVAALALVPAVASGAQLPAGFEETTVVSGLTRPTAVAWTPDGRTLAIEQDGRLKVADPGETTARTILDLTARVNAGGDRGLLGLAVDADFAANGYVYLFHTYEIDWESKTPAQRDSRGPMVSQLLRVKLDASSAVTQQQAILGTYTAGPCPTPANGLDCIPAYIDSHTVGTVRAAPDGTLFAGSGDSSSYSVVDQFAFRTYDEQSLAGKIVHVDRDGRGLPGHPFCPANANLDDVCTKVWAKGFRNPFRFVVSPADGLIVGDVGWGRREELNLIGSGGGSYGWPCVEGTSHSNAYATDPKCQAGQLGPQIYPLYDYPNPEDSDAAVLAGPRYAGSEYPPEYQGSIVFGDYAAGWLRRLDTSGPGAPSAHAFASGWWGGVDLEAAPDNGDVVYVGYGDGGPGEGEVVRIVYSPGNARPVAVADASPRASAAVPATVQFDGSDSFDDDPGDTLSYAWDFGDGESSGAMSPTHQYAEPGNYQAVLTVDDGRGKSDTDSVAIAVGNTPPDLPDVDYEPTYRGGDRIVLAGAATDAQDGPIASESLSWDVTLVHNDHDHPVFHDRVGAEQEFDDLASHDAGSHYEVELTAVDSGGLRTTRTVELHPESTTITLASEPPGARISYYDSTFAAPLTRTTAVGMRTGVSAEERFRVGDQEYLFQSWSDGGARTHPLTVPDTPTTLVARYAAVAGPPAPDPPPGPGGDRRHNAGPSLALDRRRPLTAPRALRGTASDPDAVARVRGALSRRAAKGRCRFWSARRARLLAPADCSRPLWIAARLSGPPTRRVWRLPLGGPLPKGIYRLRLVAHDRKGARATRLAGAASVRLKVR